MSDVVIQVDGLWKKYRLGVLGTGTLRHDFNRWLHRALGKPNPYAKVGEAQRSEERRAKMALPHLPSPLSPLLRRRSATTKCGPCAMSPSRSNRGKSWALSGVT